MMRPHILLASLSLVLGAFAKGGLGSKEVCDNFKSNIPNVKLNNTTYFPANATVNLSTFQSAIFATDLPAFCRLQLVITTNVTAGSTTLAEVWLPDTWNGRSLTVGNGGFAGGSTSSFDYSLFTPNTQRHPYF